MTSNAQLARSSDQRGSERISVQLAGKLFVPAEDNTLDCTIINLSTGGAGIHCFEPPPLDTFVVLYIDGFGRFDGVATRFVQGELGLRFVCKDTRIKRLEQDLEAYVKDGLIGVTRPRQHRRIGAGRQIEYFTTGNGSEFACRPADISFQGALLKTDARPAVGEIIQLGRTSACVVRHESDGIGVRFLRPRDTHRIGGLAGER
jgi:hypothetical protein